MGEFKVAYVPIGVPTFHLETAEIEFRKSIEVISQLTTSGIYPKEMLLSIDSLTKYLESIEPSLIILQNVTFANGAYVSEVLKRFSCPIILWTLRENITVGERLKLNSLTGAYSAGNIIASFRNGNFEYIFGAPDEDAVKEKLNATIKAAKLNHDLSGMKMVSIGHTPQGFGFGRALDIEMTNIFGVSLESIEARELISKAKKFTDEECKDYLDEARKVMVGLDNIPEKNILNFAKLYKSYKCYVEDNNIGALSSRCWPDFFTEFGTPVCSVLAMINDLGVAASCEADTFGALSMYMGMNLTKSAVFFGDPVSLDESENTITFWHCGTAACSLAKENEGANVGVHPNRKIGPVMDFGCKPCEKITLFRIGKKNDGKFRFFLAEGKALDKPKQFLGTSIVVQTNNNAKNIICKSIKDGWEPHFVVIYGDVIEELTILANMLNIEVCLY